MPIIGLLLLSAGLLTAFGGAIIGFWRPSALRALQWCQYGSLLVTIMAMALLMVAMLSPVPTISYAVTYQAPVAAAWGYRLAAAWAGQAGGLLLWCLELTLVALAIPLKTQPRAGAALFALRGFLFTLVLLHNPFAPATPGMRGELQPTLLDPMMLVHPPMLFLGYALLAVPFAITLAALLNRDPQRWIVQVRPWVLAAWLALTAGNGFGAAWAYRTFGWGGFWSWDPVENTSLVPWLLCAACLHALWLAPRGSRWLRRATCCALGGFIAILYGSFLARSGLLAGASVHAYVGGEHLLLWALGGLVVISTAVAVLLLWLRWRSWAIEAFVAHPAQNITCWGTVAIIGMALLVLCGMSLPVFTIFPQMSLYNAVLLPLATVLLGLLLGLQFAGASRFRQFVLLVSVLTLYLLIILISPSAVTGGNISQSLQWILSPLAMLLSAATGVSSLWLMTQSTPPVPRSACLAHFGVAALLLGTLFSGYSAEPAMWYLPVRTLVRIAGHTITVREVSATAPLGLQARITVDGRDGLLRIERNQRFSTDLRHPYINHYLGGDLYLVPIAIMPTSKRAVPAGAMLAISFKPGIALVWVGMWCIAAGILCAFFRRKHDLIRLVSETGSRQSPAAKAC
jgi:cytochrome c-type biogenesis protein CcmF